MNITVTIPDTLTPTIDAWRQMQITGDGQFFKYADTTPAATLTVDIASGATTFAISSATGYTATGR